MGARQNSRLDQFTPQAEKDRALSNYAGVVREGAKESERLWGRRAQLIRSGWLTWLPTAVPRLLFSVLEAVVR